MYNDPTVNPQNPDRSPTGLTGQQFAQGAPVYDINGDKVGTVGGVDPQSNALVIQKGLFFPKDIPVPMSAIARSDADGVYLNLSKDDAISGNFGAASATAAQTSYGGTAPSDIGTGPRERAATGEDIAVPVREEELIAGKERGEAGRVHIGKDVVQEQQSINVPVTHEEVSVEWVPVDRDVPADQLGADAWQEKDIDVPLMGEQVTTDKRARVTEEVRLQKTPVTEQQQVSDTVRKERVRLEGQGDVPIEGGDDQDQTSPRQ